MQDHVAHGREGYPSLEVLSGGTGRGDGPPILLVHGAWHGAWCWESGFMDRLAQDGHEVHALSLRGHGGSEGRDRLRTTRIRDYVSDVARVAGTLRAPPVVVGHSMGALVVQKYLETHPAPGAVLLAPMPLHGVAPLTGKMLRTDPVGVLMSNLTMSLSAVVSTPDKARRLFFSEDMPAPEVDRHQARLQPEAFLAYLDMLGLDLCHPARVDAPVLVLGAGKDAVFTRREVEAVAAAHGTVAEFYEDMAHDMMLERDRLLVASRISAWVAELGSFSYRPARVA